MAQHIKNNVNLAKQDHTPPSHEETADHTNSIQAPLTLSLLFHDKEHTKEISNILVVGDSLSAEGYIWEQPLPPFKHIFHHDYFPKLLSYIRGQCLIKWGGLSETTVHEFTNGHVWTREAIEFSSIHYLDQQKKELARLEDETRRNPYIDADQQIRLIAKYQGVEQQLNKKMSMNTSALFKNKPIDHLYYNVAEGGASVYDFKTYRSWQILHMLKCVIMGFLLTNQKQQIKKALQLEQQTPHAHPLLLCWMMANDLITFQKNPSAKQLKKSLKTYETNIKYLKKKNPQMEVVIMGLPDPSPAPRFQKSEPTVKATVKKFFTEADSELKKIAERNDCRFLDIQPAYKHMSDHPQDYGLDPEIANQSCQDNGSCPVIYKDGRAIAPAKGEAYYDHEHPSTQVHALLGSAIGTAISQNYNFQPSCYKAIMQANLHNFSPTTSLFNQKRTEMIPLSSNTAMASQDTTPSLRLRSPG